MRQSDPRTAAGRRLLRILLPRAEERSKTAGYSWKPMSALGRAQSPYLRVDNIDAVMIYQAPKGGWHGDVVMKQVPVGIPNVLGTPVENPCPSREMAVDMAVSLLAQIIGGERIKGAVPPPIALPAFLFHGYEVNLVSDILELIPGYESTEHALKRLGEIEHELFPVGVPHDELRLEDERFRSFMAVVHMAVKTGVYRYPPKRDSEPTAEGPFLDDEPVA